MTTLLTAKAQIAISQPQPMLDQLCNHLVEHGAGHARQDKRHDLRFPFGSATLTQTQEGVTAEVRGETLFSIVELRSIIAGHMQEFAPAPLDIRWTGDGEQITRPPNYRVLRVTGLRNLTPRMRRIRFAAEDLAIFAGLDNIHVRLVFAPDASGLVQPELGADGLERWPEGDLAPAFRRYTIRDIDVVAGHLDIDFVLHAEAAGPGSRFAETARTGDLIGMIGPGGGSLPLDRDWYLIAGDETALPAIARFLELLPKDVHGQVLIEIDNDAERQMLVDRPRLNVAWIKRPKSLAQAVSTCRPPAGVDRPFVWIGTEDGDFRKLRAFVRQDLMMKKGQHSVVCYWRHGHAAA